MLPVGSSRRSCCATFEGQPTGAVRRHARERRPPKPARGECVPNRMGCVPAYLKCVPAFPGCAPQWPIKQGANLGCEPAYPGCEPKKNRCNWRIRALLPPAYCNRPEGPKEGPTVVGAEGLSECETRGRTNMAAQMALFVSNRSHTRAVGLALNNFLQRLRRRERIPVKKEARLALAATRIKVGSFLQRSGKSCRDRIYVNRSRTQFSLNGFSFFTAAFFKARFSYRFAS